MAFRRVRPFSGQSGYLQVAQRWLYMAALTAWLANGCGAPEPELGQGRKCVTAATLTADEPADKSDGKAADKPDGKATDKADGKATSAGKVTYWEKIEPLLKNKCVICHMPGLIVPDLSTFELAKANAQTSKASIDDDTMAPGAPLPADEKKLYAQWITDGMVEGTKPAAQPTATSAGSANATTGCPASGG